MHAACLCSLLWRWKVVCECVCVIMCLDLCLYMMFWSSHSPAPSPKQTSQAFAITCSLRLQDQSTGIMVSISRKRGRWSAHLHRSLPSQFPPSFSFFHFNTIYLFLPLVLSFCPFEQCFLSILPLISLLRSHSLVALFSLCGKCQVCRWCYLHENWEGQRLLAIFHIYCLVWYLGGQQKMAQKYNLSISRWMTSKPSVVRERYLNRQVRRAVEASFLLLIEMSWWELHVSEAAAAVPGVWKMARYVKPMPTLGYLQV